MTEKIIVHIPVPHTAEVEKWQSEASVYDYSDEREAHIAKRAAAWGAAAGVELAIKDTAHCHWRVADEGGTQLARLSDLTSWANCLRKLAVFNDIEDSE